ncbi:MAG TPA: VOC family protein, partial [Gaiellaceae bacterium]|nr:VOC family protein [Gaiellaceae bacterium]
MAGKLVHVEINAADADRAQGFWSGVFGWEVGPPMSPEMDYRMFQTAENQGGAIVGTDEKGPLRVYFDTEDIDGTIAKVRELGGEAEDKMPVQGYGWFAGCRDTEG